jgi:hypothetical protein
MINLNQTAQEIAIDERGKVAISVAQIKEILGVLGRRWRGEGYASMSPAEIQAEINAIVQRAGRRKK